MRYGRMLATSLMVLGCGLACAHAQQSPYAGQQTRTIKAFSQADIEALRDGTGMGMAKAGELNGYPGPAHVLGMATMLNLTEQQRTAIDGVMARMSASAKVIGAEILAKESDLDRRFADGTITPPYLATATRCIGDLQGQLRAVHLQAHLDTKRLLSPPQIAMYNKMRGYGSNGDHSSMPGMEMHGG